MTNSNESTADGFAGDVESFRTASWESDAHLWAKLEFDRRKRRAEDPWFDGAYRFERKVADRVPDCYVVSPRVNRWVEFVDGSEQEYRAKTREALRLGFVIHWVFHDDRDAQRVAAHAALDDEIRGPVTFGTFNDATGTLHVGDPVTYRNYDFRVETMNEFDVDEILGYRSGAAGVRSFNGVGYDLGVFDIVGFQCRLGVLGRDGELFCAVPVGESFSDVTWGFPSRSGLERVVEAGKVTRVGPVG